MATSAVPTPQLFPITKWAARSGRTAAHLQWWSGVRQLLAALSLTEDQIDEHPPSVPAIDTLITGYGGGVTRSARARAVRERMAAIDALEAWQRVNTALYWHLRPSLLLTGPDALNDTRYFDTLFQLDVADGRALLRWALDGVRFDARDCQINLLRALTTVRIKPTATRAQLKVHAQEMREVWLLLEGVDPLAPLGLSDLYDFLVASVPAQPVTSHLVSVRTWLTGQVAQYKAGQNVQFIDYLAALSAMDEYARVLGLPAGDPKAAAMVDIASNGIVTFSADGSSGGGGSLLSLRQPRPPPAKPDDAPGNNCSFCDSWWCDALKKASTSDSKQFCICCFNSDFDATGLSKGKDYVLSRREYHKSHPDITTLKGLKLWRKSDGTVVEATEGGGKGKGRGGRGRGRGRQGSLNMMGADTSESLAQLQQAPSPSPPTEHEQSLMQRDGESFDQWLERNDSAAPSLSVIIGKHTLPATAVVFDEGNLRVIDDDELPAHFYTPYEPNEDIDHAIAESIDDQLKLELNAPANDVALDHAIAMRSQSLEDALTQEANVQELQQIAADEDYAQRMQHALNDGIHIDDDDDDLALESNVPTVDMELDHALAQSLHDQFTLESNAQLLQQLEHDKCLARHVQRQLDGDGGEQGKLNGGSIGQGELANGSGNRQKHNGLLTSRIGPPGNFLLMLGGGALSAVAETEGEGDDNDGNDEDDQGSINDVEITGSQALREAQAALAERDAALGELQAQQNRDSAQIAQLKQQLSTTLNRPTPNGKQGLLGTPSTRSPYARHSLASTPTACNPALISAESLRAATPSLSDVGGEDNSDNNFSSPTPLQAPLPQLFTLGDNEKSKTDKRSISEHLANAMVLNEQQLRLSKDKQSKRSIIADTFMKVITLASSHVPTFTPQQWASIIVIAQVVRPWLQPLTKIIWDYFIDQLKIFITRTLNAGKSLTCNMLLKAVCRLSELQQRLNWSRGTIAANGLSAACSDSAAANAPTGSGTAGTIVHDDNSGGANDPTESAMMVGIGGASSAKHTGPDDLWANSGTKEPGNGNGNAAGTLMMLGMGSSSKRTAPDGLMQQGDDEMALLMAAWQMLKQTESVTNSRKELADLATLLGQKRLHEVTYYNTASVLALRIWPERFANLKASLVHFGAGIVRATDNATARALDKALSQLIGRLGMERVQHACSEAEMLACTSLEASAASTLTTLLPTMASELEHALTTDSSAGEPSLVITPGIQLVSTPKVGTVVGTSADPNRPVVLRLSLPTIGMLHLITDKPLSDNSTSLEAEQHLEAIADSQRIMGQLLWCTQRDESSDGWLSAIDDALRCICPVCEAADCACECTPIDPNANWLAHDTSAAVAHASMAGSMEWDRASDYNSSEELNGFFSQTPIGSPTGSPVLTSQTPLGSPMSVVDIADGLMLRGQSLFMMGLNHAPSLAVLKSRGNARTNAQPNRTEQHVYPPGTLTSDDNCVAALCDNGASKRVTCFRTLDGALLDTLNTNDAGELTVGAEDAGLGSQGSYVYVFEWFGSDGSGGLVARRAKHTPKLPLDVVISEPTEVFDHKAKFVFDDQHGRVMTTRTGQRIPLWMSEESGLAYLKVRVVTDPSKIQLALGCAGSVLLIGVGESLRHGCGIMALGEGEKRSVGMPSPSALSGVALLRTTHVIYGHASLRKTLQILKAMGTPSSRITTEDIKEWIRIGCGICESSKMRRRVFTLQSPEDRTPAPVGKKWTWDSLALRVPSAYHGFTAIFVAVDSGSKYKFGIGLLGQSSDDYIKAHNALRAFTRPHHGEIFIVKGDAHSTHRSRALSEYFLTQSTPTLKQVGPGQVHEFVGDAENALLHAVPVACGYLMGSPDLGESHLYSAFLTSFAASNYAVVSGCTDETGISSPIMPFLGKTEWIPCPLYAYGAGAKAFVHERESGFDLHARPCVYTGPAHNSNSPIHCSVWDGNRYYDVDVGCLNVDDRVVLARTSRTHPSHQPFNQEGVHKDVEINTEQWYDPLSERHPMDVAASERVSDCTLPSYAGVVWVAGMAPPDRPFTLGLGSGPAREGDIAGFLHALTGGQHVHIRIDPVIGGYEHRVERPHVRDALVLLSTHHLCRGGIASLPCGPWSLAKMSGDNGPTPIFTADHRDGVPDADSAAKVQAAMAYVHGGVAILRAMLANDSADSPKVVISEHPAGHGLGTVLPYKGAEQHSTMHDTTPFQQLIRDFQLSSVITDLGASGHDHQKPTELLCSVRAVDAVRRILGTRSVPPDFVPTGEPLRGKDEHGNYRTKAEQEYRPPLCKRLASCVVESLNVASTDDAAVEGGVINNETNAPEHAIETNAPEHAIANDSAVMTTELGFSIGERVEVYWTGEHKWFAGTVTDNTGIHKYKSKGRSMQSPELIISYDDGWTKTHSLHNTDVRIEGGAPSLFAIMDGRAVKSDAALIPKDNHDMVLVLSDVEIDLETSQVFNKQTIFIVSGEENKLIAAAQMNSMNTLNARYWHEPKNERDFELSPQRALWQTAKELKWDEYVALKMFEWVPITDVDRLKHKIYNTLWAYKIKLHSDLTFNKLSPRWCLKGGTMDRDIYKSHQETLRITTFRIILALKAGYWDAFSPFLLDCSNAFQNTRTDGDFSGTSPTIYCNPAPGFEREVDGVRMVCKLTVGMQGRIDATSLFNNRLFALLLVKAGIARALWDRQLMIYHHGSTSGTSLPLSELLTKIKTEKDTDAQQQPVGYALIGWHVDDGTGIACSVGWDLNFETNRVVKFLRGTIETLFATTLTGWHGYKALGFTLTLKNRTVNMSAPDAVAQLAKDLLGDKVVIAPKQAITKEFFAIERQAEVSRDDPSYAPTISRMALTRHGLGVSIWLSLCYIEIMRGTNELCSNMQFPSEVTHKCLCYQTMYLQAHGKGITYGPCSFGSLERDPKVNVSSPRTGATLPFFHYFSDANLATSSITGGIGMLAKGAIMGVSQRQQLASPCAHTSEIVAASTNLNLLIPVSGVLQEVHVRCGAKVPFYLDSKTTVFVAKSDTAIKKSVWLIRRAAVLEDGVVNGEIEPIHISEQDMAADPFTKYLPRDVWIRHMIFVMNGMNTVD